MLNRKNKNQKKRQLQTFKYAATIRVVAQTHQIEARAQQVFLSFMRASQSIELLRQKLVELPQQIIWIQRRVRSYQEIMRYRRIIFKQLFAREHFSMKMHFNTKAKKNKQFKIQAKKFEGLVDDQISQLLLNEYLSNVCQAFCRYNLTIFMNYKKEVAKRAKEMVQADNLLYESDCIEEIMSAPVALNQEDSFELFIQRERIKHHLKNLLTGTKEEQVVGELDLAVSIALKNKQEQQVH